MMHVVHVVHALGVGGTENGVVNLIGASGAELRHTVISMTEGGPLVARLPGGVAVHCLGKSPGIEGRAFLRLAALLRRLRPDVVHSRNWGAFDAVAAARLGRVPVVVHGEHGREAHDPEGLNRRRNRLRRLMAPLVDRFVAVSEDLRRWLIERVGVPAGKVSTICNGVDTSRFGGDDREAGRRALAVADETFVIGTVGRLDPVKDQMGLLEAFASLDGKARRCLLVIVGDGPCREPLEEQARRPGLAGRVRFLGQRLDVPLLLNGFDVFVLPSIAEGISNTILEAMATGLPVVATCVGGNPELVDDGVTGIHVPVRNPRRLGEAIAAYLGDPGLGLRHGRAGRERAVREFGLDRMVEQYRDLYRSLAAAKGVGRA